MGCPLETRADYPFAGGVLAISEVELPVISPMQMLQDTVEEAQ